jgi:hypothetical protein
MADLPLQTRMSLSTSYSSAPRHRLVEFGDGYIQRTPLGVNYQRRSLSVTHENLSASDAATLILFYENRYFYADAIEIDANELLTRDGKYYLESFDVQMADGDKRTINATMLEVFDL